jgi:hypothetical protein
VKGCNTGDEKNHVKFRDIFFRLRWENPYWRTHTATPPISPGLYMSRDFLRL